MTQIWMVTMDYVPKNRPLTTIAGEVSTGLTAFWNTLKAWYISTEWNSIKCWVTTLETSLEIIMIIRSLWVFVFYECFIQRDELYTTHQHLITEDSITLSQANMTHCKPLSTITFKSQIIVTLFKAIMHNWSTLQVTTRKNTLLSHSDLQNMFCRLCKLM